eukprot:TRINITY_DN6136_c0_g1_i1.p1 TRINITY_DN6136_c0_g1~~TRINITY_DN6136_c0_g1_i1.p1  ORF type:complete len:2441 (+),score=593.20 TRINITY_DN6136_c0_g1_i1:53-7324(+)
MDPTTWAKNWTRDCNAKKNMTLSEQMSHIYMLFDFLELYYGELPNNVLNILMPNNFVSLVDCIVGNKKSLKHVRRGNLFVKKCGALFGKVPQLYDNLKAFIAQSFGEQHVGVASMLLRHSVLSGKDDIEYFCDLYVKGVIKTVAANDIHDRFIDIARTINEEQFDNFLRESFVVQVGRNPKAFSVLEHFVVNSKLDFSNFIQELSALAFDKIFNNEPSKPIVLPALKALTSRSSVESVEISLLENIEYLKGKVQLKYPYQKVALIQGCEAMYKEGLSVDSLSEIVHTVVSTIEGEKNAEAEAEEIVSLAQFCHMLPEINDELVNLVLSGLAKKASEGYFIFLALSNLLSKVDSAPFVPILSKTIEDVQKKPVLRVSAVCSLDVLCACEGDFSSVVSKAVCADSFLYADNFLAKLAEQELQWEIIVSLLTNVISKYYNLVEQLPQFWILVVKTLMQLPSKSRDVLSANLNTLFDEISSDISVSLLNSIHSLLQENPSLAEKSLRTVIVNVTGINLPENYYGLVVLLSHYPTIEKNRQSTVWNNVVNKISPHFTSETVFDISCFLLGDDGLYNKHKNFRKAFINGFRGVAASLSDNFFASELVEPIFDHLNSARWSSLTEKQVGIFNNNPNEIYIGVNDPYRPEVVSKGKANEDPWEREQRRLRGEYTPEERQRMEEDRQILAQQAVVRKEVAFIYETILTALSTVVELISACPNSLNQIFFKLIDEMLTLETYQNFKNPIRSALSKISKKSFSDLDLAQTISLCLPVIKKDEEFTEFKLAFFRPVVEKISSLTLPLPGYMFAQVVPIICKSLEHESSLEHTDMGLTILESHVGRCYTNFFLDSLFFVSKLLACRDRATDAIMQFSSTINIEADVQLTEVYQKYIHAPLESTRNLVASSVSQIPFIREFLESNILFKIELYTLCFDSNNETVSITNQLFEGLEPVYEDLENMQYLIEKIFVLNHDIQDIIATAVVNMVESSSDVSFHQSLLDLIFVNYEKYLPKTRMDDKRAPVLNLARRGCSRLLFKSAKLSYQEQMLDQVFHFLFEKALLDEDDETQGLYVDCGIELIQSQGAAYTDQLLSLFRKKMDTSNKGKIRQSLVIFMGCVAQNINDSRIMEIVELLLETMKNSSPTVQRAVGNCLENILPNIPEEAPRLVEESLELCLGGAKPTQRRGGAFALAAYVKALGYQSLKNLNILPRIIESLSDSDHGRRQGGLLAIEKISRKIGSFFEPYIVKLLNPLLISFGDEHSNVRNAASSAAQSIMSNLTSRATRVVVKELIVALQDSNWRTKCGSIELLSSMAYCSPEPLSACLPLIVPELTKTLTSTHLKVQETGKEALNAIGSVIKNPEIQEHVPLILNALFDPLKHMKPALGALLETKYVHHIDSASLALIMPLCIDALRDRNTETKTRAAKIVGNLCKLTSQKVLTPYLDMLLPNIIELTLDPIPNTRAMASKAIGTLVRGIGMEKFPQVLPWFFTRIQSDQGYITRTGAAQGLSEIMVGLPGEQLENEIFPAIEQLVASDKYNTRQGAISVFQFLPDADKVRFEQYLPLFLPTITKALADEVEDVREAAQKAGQAVVSAYARSAMPLLLETLQSCMFDDSWRIRMSAVQLLEVFLQQIVSSSDSDQFKDLSELIEDDMGRRILAELFIVRHDPNGAVCSAALICWKSVIMNANKVLLPVLPSLVLRLINYFSSHNDERIAVAFSTMEDIVSKLSSRIFDQIVTILLRELELERNLEGVCLSLAAAIKASPKHIIVEYFAILSPPIQNALSFPDPKIQEAAALAFSNLSASIGGKVVEEVLPNLLKQLDSNDESESAHALNGIKQIISVSSDSVLSSLVPKLLSSPIQIHKANALASITEVCGPAINNFVPEIISKYLEENNKEDNLLYSAAETFCLSLGEESLPSLIKELVKLLNDRKLAMRNYGSCLVRRFTSSTSLPYTAYYRSLIPPLLILLNDTQEDVRKNSLRSIGNITATIDPAEDDVIPLVLDMNVTLNQLKRGLKRGHIQNTLPGLGIRKSLDAIINLYLIPIRQAEDDLKEKLVSGLRDIIAITPTKILEKYVVDISGTLIRIFNERKPEDLKTSIFRTVNLLLDTNCKSLKISITQLQTTYVKGISDGQRSVREIAGQGLEKLLRNGVRLDFLLKELLRLLNSSDTESQLSILGALKTMLINVKDIKKPKDQLSVELQSAIIEFVSSGNIELGTIASQTIGPFCKLLSPNLYEDLVDELLITDSNDAVQYCLILSVNSVLAQKLGIFEGRGRDLTYWLVGLSESESPNIRKGTARVLGFLFTMVNDESMETTIIETLIDMVNDSANDVKAAALHAIAKGAKSAEDHHKYLRHLPKLVDPIFHRTGNAKLAKVKYAAERALFYLFGYHTEFIMEDYLANVPENKASVIRAFANKVLARKEISEDEEAWDT